MTILRIPRRLLEAVHADLDRPHPVASERVGFLEVRLGNQDGDERILLASGYFPVLDEHYLDDPTVGAAINGDAIRGALFRAMTANVGVLHVHRHEHRGVPSFSKIDRSSYPAIARNLRVVAPSCAHGAIVLSRDSATAGVWLPNLEDETTCRVVSVGRPMRVLSSSNRAEPTQDSHDRQGFLGPLFPPGRTGLRLGIIGHSGGGSHAVQQCAHVGFENYLNIDPDTIGPENLHRHVGATRQDVADETPKVSISERVIRAVRQHPLVTSIQADWRDCTTQLRGVDVMIGCVDGLDLRLQMEAFARRYLIPYLDIGLTVFPPTAGQPPQMVGHVFLSMPDGPCFRCLQVITERDLREEARERGYGSPAVAQQVVSANGVLASAAVGLLLDLVSGWSGDDAAPFLLQYNGNRGELMVSRKLTPLPSFPCSHYPPGSVGDPKGRAL
jgi:molybdopterin/thiamine biosynthesis adenylyltransferase